MIIKSYFLISKEIFILFFITLTGKDISLENKSLS